MKNTTGILKCFLTLFLFSLALIEVTQAGRSSSSSSKSSKSKRNSTETEQPTSKVNCIGDEFSCGDLCLNSTLICDGTPNCADRSDEANCTPKDCFGPDWFICKNKKCISKKWVCDGIDDCSLNGDGDVSDEMDCDPKAGSTTKKESARTGEPEVCNMTISMLCKSEECLPKNFFCDGDKDCSDGDDEGPQCEEHLKNKCEGQFLCISGECLDLKFKCDSIVDCLDGWSDEDNCTKIKPQDCSKEEGKFSCKSGIGCIERSQVCDKTAHCPDKSDEYPDCEKSCGNSTCSQGCLPDSADPLKPGSCYCFKGFKESRRDKGKCEDEDECLKFGSCSQGCTNLLGSFECSCINGFRLSHDNSSCELIDDDASLIFALHSGIRVLEMGKRNKYYPIIDKVGSPVSVSYNARGKWVYWTDAMEHEEAIWKSRLDGTEIQPVVTTGLVLPEGIAYDWIADNIYFTDSNKSHIVVCSAKDTICTVLIQQQLDKPRDIALHPNLGLMFWTDWGISPGIIRAGMDGSLPIPIVTENVKWPNGITVDQGNSRLYWTDANLDRIETVALDGNDRRVVRSTGIKHPFGVDVIGDMVFWSDWNLYEIQASNKFDGSSHSTLVKEPFEQLNGLAIFHKANQPTTRRNNCENAGCSHICVLTPGNSFRCTCPMGMNLDKNKKKCSDNPNWPKFLIAYNNTIKTSRLESIGRNVFEEIVIPELRDIGGIVYNPLKHTVILSDLELRKIFEYDLTHKNLSVLVGNDIHFVKGIDLDIVGNNLYWVDSVKKTVEVMSLRTKTRVILFKEIERPIDIVVAPDRNLIFIALVGFEGSGKIIRMNMNGFNRRLLIKTVNGEPLGLTYNREVDHLYWTDAASEAIHTVSVDGSLDYIVEYRAGAPYGIASYENKIFWTDRHSQMLKGKRLDVFSQERSIFIGNYSHLPKSSLTLPSFFDGFFHAKVAVIHNDLRFLDGIMGIHECSTQARLSRNCSHICLLSAEQFKGTCACPETLKLDMDGKNCVSIKAGEVPIPVLCSGGRCRTTTTKRPKSSGKSKSKSISPATDSSKTPPTTTKKSCKGSKCNVEKDKEDSKKDDSIWTTLLGIDDDDNDKLQDGIKENKHSDRELRREKEKSASFLEYDYYDGSLTKDELYGRSLGGDEDGAEEPKTIGSDGGHPFAIVLGVLMFVVLFGIIIGIILYRKNVQPKVLVRPYVQQWVKYVNQPVHRFFDSHNRGDKLDGGKQNVYDEVYHGSGLTYSNAGYEEIDAITDLQHREQANQNIYEEPTDTHRISYSQKERLIDDKDMV